MAIIDKVQGTFEKLTGDDTRMNAAEIVTIQQAYHALQLGYVKIEWYLAHVQNPEVKNVLKELRDEFVKPYVEKPRRMFEKSGIPFVNLNVENRLQQIPTTKGQTFFFRDEEVLLDTVFSLQATITGLQAGALTAVRGDVRDYFLNARDAAMDQWRKVGVAAYKLIPEAIPPTMSGVRSP